MMIPSDLLGPLILIILIILIFRFQNYLHTVYLAFTVRGPSGLPIIGNALIVTDDHKMLKIAQNAVSLYGPIFRIWVSFLPIFCITEPCHIQLVLSTNKYSDKNLFYSFLHNFLGKGLITSTGTKWKTNRKLIQPYFHINVLKVFFDAFLKQSTSIVEQLESDTNITPLINKYVLSVLHETILGKSTQEPDIISTSPFRKGKVSLIERVSRPWLLLDSIFNCTERSLNETKQKRNLQKYIKSILEEKRDDSAPTNQNLMDMLMEIHRENSDFTEEDIVEETCTFMLAGQDSVGAALAFSLFFLAKHQEIQDKVFKELETIFHDDRPETFEDTHEMKYLEQCLKETMRLCPSVPVFMRKVTEDVQIGDHFFPTGTNLLISPFITHRLEHHFSDASFFNPERFSPENFSQIHPFAFIPFSAGPRNCIGYKFAIIQMKTLISSILRKYQISITPGHEKLHLHFRVTLRAKGGIWLNFKSRN